MRYKSLCNNTIHISSLMRAFLCCLMFTNFSLLFAQDNTSVSYKVKCYHDNGIYGPQDSKVAYIIKLKNNINDNQKGNIYVEVRNDIGQSMYHDDISMFIKPAGSYIKEIEIDIAKLPTGFYNISFNINTNHYKQYLYYVFGVEPEKLKPSGIHPYDFSAFWDNARNELANINPGFKITRRGDVSTVKNDVYLIEFQSIDNETIRGWLSVPKNHNKNAVLYRLPDYVSVAAPESRSDMAVLCLDARFTGNSADKQRLDANSFLLQGLSNKNNYIYRSLFMDCLRGIDFIMKNPDLKLDGSKIIVTGIGQGAALAAVVAGFDSRVKGLVMDRPTLIDMRTIFSVGEIKPVAPWPIPTFKGYFNYSKMPIDNFFKTWDYFDGLNFATLIKCPTLIGTSLKSSISLPQSAYNFYNQVLSSKREIYVCPDNESGIDESFYIFENNWIKEILRL